MASDESVIEWLLGGDPAIRWQVQRDLLGEPAETWEPERRRTVTTGWVSELLARRGADGEWPAGLADPIDLLREKQQPNGRWPLQKRIPGTLLVEMEKPGQDSRWNTLRALQVLRHHDEIAPR